MVHLLNVEKLALSEKIPPEYLCSIAIEIARDGQADRFLNGKILVKFDPIEFEAVRSALVTDGRLSDLSTQLRMNADLAKELVLRFGETNTLASKEKLERLLSSSAAKLELELNPPPGDIVVNSEISVQVLIKSDAELDEPKLSVEVSDGLVVLERPNPISLIPQSEEGYVDALKIRPVEPGEQFVRLQLAARQSTTIVEKALERKILVRSLPPKLEARLVGAPERALLGQQFPLVLNMHNSGGGSAKAVKIRGLEALSTILKVVQALPENIEIPAQASSEFPIIFLASRSGTARAERVLLEFEDLDGRSFVIDLGGLQLEVVTPQPDIKVSASLPKVISAGAETRVEYTVGNYAQGEARNVRIRFVLVPSATLLRGAVSRTIPVLRAQQFEVGQFDIKVASEAGSPAAIDHVELSFSDAEGATKTINIPQDLLGVQSPLLVASQVPDVGAAISSHREQQNESIVTDQPKLDVAKLLANGKTEDWLCALESGKYKKIDFADLMDSEDAYGQEGYHNLLLAIYQSKLSFKDLSMLLDGDKFTYRCTEFLCALKSEGEIEYSISSSDVQNADQILKIIGTSASEDSSAASPKPVTQRARKAPTMIFKPKRFAFENSKREKIVISRQVIVDEASGRPESVKYSLFKEGTADEGSKSSGQFDSTEH
jgi:hypothetical protein